MSSVEQQPHLAKGATDHTGAAAMMDRDLASASAGVRVTAIGDGSAESTMTVRDDMANGHGITHGGFVFLLADTAFACACNDSRGVTVAAGADITFLAATRPGDVLIARAARRSERGRSGIYDVTVTRRDPGGEQVVAEFRGRSRTLPSR
ncbi:MAG: hydroxyphenylacetyl-CoA thioesterase PaaI [Nakamurella sp.]